MDMVSLCHSPTRGPTTPTAAVCSWVFVGHVTCVDACIDDKEDDMEDYMIYLKRKDKTYQMPS